MLSQSSPGYQMSSIHVVIVLLWCPICCSSLLRQGRLAVEVCSEGNTWSAFKSMLTSTANRTCSRRIRLLRAVEQRAAYIHDTSSQCAVQHCAGVQRAVQNFNAHLRHGSAFQRRVALGCADSHALMVRANLTRYLLPSRDNSTSIYCGR